MNEYPTYSTLPIQKFTPLVFSSWGHEAIDNKNDCQKYRKKIKYFQFLVFIIFRFNGYTIWDCLTLYRYLLQLYPKKTYLLLKRQAGLNNRVHQSYLRTYNVNSAPFVTKIEHSRWNKNRKASLHHVIKLGDRQDTSEECAVNK